MPWSKRKTDGGWEVINSETGEVKGSHDSEESADSQLAALYANASPEEEGLDKMDNMFIPIMKVNAERHEVWGWGALEQPDASDEIMDYASSKPYFLDWSSRAQKRSGGKSLGNVRAMHQNIAVRKLIELRADDVNKGFFVGAKIVDDDEWKKVETGVYTGFSIGGNYAKRWSDFSNPGKIRYTAKPSELSIVDAPCIPDATFQVVKADGTLVKRRFKPGENKNMITVIPAPRMLKVVRAGELAKEEWEENKHPRANDGKFTSGGGGGGGKTAGGGGDEEREKRIKRTMDIQAGKKPEYPAKEKKVGGMTSKQYAAGMQRGVDDIKRWNANREKNKAAKPAQPKGDATNERDKMADVQQRMDQNKNRQAAAESYMHRRDALVNYKSKLDSHDGAGHELVRAGIKASERLARHNIDKSKGKTSEVEDKDLDALASAVRRAEVYMDASNKEKARILRDGEHKPAQPKAEARKLGKVTKGEVMSKLQSIYERLIKIEDELEQGDFEDEAPLDEEEPIEKEAVDEESLPEDDMEEADDEIMESPPVEKLAKQEIPGAPEHLAETPLKSEVGPSYEVQNMPPPNTLMEIKPGSEPTQDALAEHAVMAKDLTAAFNAWLPKVGVLVKAAVDEGIARAMADLSKNTGSAPAQTKTVISRPIKVRKE